MFLSRIFNVFVLNICDVFGYGGFVDDRSGIGDDILFRDFGDDLGMW
jgi:hypothetical protein